MKMNAQLRKTISEMVAERRQYAKANGFTVTDEEIADHVALRLVQMMKEAK